MQKLGQHLCAPAHTRLVVVAARKGGGGGDLHHFVPQYSTEAFLVFRQQQLSVGKKNVEEQSMYWMATKDNKSKETVHTTESYISPMMQQQLRTF